MKFENLYRLVINEAEAIEDVKELSTDPVSQTGTMQPQEKTPDMMSYEDKVDFLIKNHAWKTKNLTDDEKAAKARYIIDNDFFESAYEGIMARKEREEQEAGVLGELPQELEDPNATPDDIRDIQAGLSDYERMKKLEGEGEEEFGGQDL